MQSFLTSPYSFEQTSAELDNKRLHKQTLEAWQCLLTITNLDPDGNHREPKGWSNHPVARMWRGYETALVSYISATYFEWRSRGYKSTLLEKTYRTYDQAVKLGRVSTDLVLPSWMTDAKYYLDLCSTHRTALLCKHYDWYKQFNWPEDTGTAPSTYTYLWPHQDGYAA
ncbi:pyrimidine dimer DNA glycosylase [Actinomycetia phage DSL-LC01]|nr:pyrimidine dimer DNA glycosylase [Actinomycetia phage DSL-LC01]